jgi:hypothetical protein
MELRRCGREICDGRRAQMKAATEKHQAKKAGG